MALLLKHTIDHVIEAARTRLQASLATFVAEVSDAMLLTDDGDVIPAPQSFKTVNDPSAFPLVVVAANGSDSGSEDQAGDDVHRFQVRYYLVGADRDLLARWVRGYAWAVREVFIDSTLDGVASSVNWIADDPGPVLRTPQTNDSLMQFGYSTFEALVMEPAMKLNI